MRRSFFASCFIFLFSLCTIAQTPTATPDPAASDEVVKIRTTLIQLDVVVTGKNGKQITDLKPEDFEILENGKKQEITNFSYVAVAPDKPAAPASKTQPKPGDVSTPETPVKLKPEQVRRTIALVVDDLGLSFLSMIHVRTALKRFVDEQMREGDLVAVIRTAGGIGTIQQFTTDKQQLRSIIESLRWYPLGRAGAGLQIAAEARASENQVQRDSFLEGTIGALNYIINGMSELPGRKAVVLLSDGMPLATVDDEGGIDETGRILDSLRLLAELANRASVVINTIDARGLPASPNSRTSLAEASSLLEAIGPNMSATSYDTQEGMISIAQQTGGYAFYNNNDVKGSIQTVLENQNGYYLIAYQPDEASFDPGARRFNKLKVTVRRPGLKVNYRNGFFGVTDEEISRAENPGAAEQMATALTSPFGAAGVRLRLNSMFASDAQNGSFIRSFLHIQAQDLKFTDEENGDKKAVLDIVAYTFGDNGVSIDRLSQTYTLIVKAEQYRQILERGFVYRINLPVKKPGAYQLRVALRDAQSEKIGAASHFVEVPDLKKKRLTLSGIVLQSLTKEQVEQITREGSLLVEKKKPGEVDPEIDTALRQFRAGSYLQYAYTIYNAQPGSGGQPQLETQLRLFQNGKLVVERKAQAVETRGQVDPERINYNGAVALPPELAPGNYVMQVIVNDRLAAERSAATATQWIDFEIIR